MPELDNTSLDYWRSHVVEWIETHLINPETGQPYQLYPAEKLFITYMFMIGADGRLIHSDWIYSCGKKGGKTEFGAIIMIVTILLFGGMRAEGYAIANDLDQATSRVFERCCRIIAVSPLLKRDARVTSDRISFISTGASIVALAADYTGAAGGHPTLAVFDEIWGYFTERGRRMWDEMIPVPSRKISARMIVSHAGFQGQSELLYELYQFGLKQPEVAPCLYSGSGQLMFWTHEPISPLQTEAWRADMRVKLRGNQYQRMVENYFVTGDNAFLSMAQWAAITDSNARPLLSDRNLPVWIGCDASTRHDSTALAAVAYDAEAKQVKLINHRIFTPTTGRPIDFERMIEDVLVDWRNRYKIRSVTYDPYQMVASAQRLLRHESMPMQELPQTTGNLTEMSSNLFELVTARNLVVYPDEQIRTAVARTVAIEGRGWKISKEKTSHHIDIVIALSMACLACVREQKKPRKRVLFSTYGTLGYHPLYEITPHGMIELDRATGKRIERSRLVRGADGRVYLCGGNNGCRPGPGIPNRNSQT